MWRRLKRLLCRHWFDEQEPYEHEYSSGDIICFERRQFRIKIQLRVCSKCGLKEERRIGEPAYLGWG